MQQFSIKAMERLTGIKAHTLRVWEQRYAILKPLRRDGNHRFYSNEDLKCLLKVVFLYEKGMRIGEIAQLNQDEIQSRMQLELKAGDAARLFLIEMMEAILVFDERSLDEIFNRVRNQFGFVEGMLEVIFPLLNRVGLLWTTDRIAPGQEHFASHFIMRKTLLAINSLAKTSGKSVEKILVFAPKGEFHEIGVLFMNYLFRLNGYCTVYLGVNTDFGIVELFYQNWQPTHLFMHLTSNLQDEDPEEYIRAVINRYPGAKVLVGGQVVSRLKDMPGCKILRNQQEMLQCSRKIFEVN